MDVLILRNAGLSEHEARVYAKLIEYNLCTASALAKLVHLNRTTTYLQLDRLKDLGLVSYVIKNGKRYFQPANPEKLIEILNERKRKIEEIMPSLKMLHTFTPEYNIEVYEGKEGIKTFYEDILKIGKDFCAFGVTGKAFDVLEYSFPHFVEKGKKAKIHARYIANVSARKALKAGLNPNFKIKYLSDEFSAEVTTIIYGKKVAIQSLVKEQIFVIVISHSATSKSYQAYFEFLWNLAK
jgi:sugar-specific transcriptional regulator TrmB